jgi:hypothetical protein
VRKEILQIYDLGLVFFLEFSSPKCEIGFIESKRAAFTGSNQAAA